MFIYVKYVGGIIFTLSIEIVETECVLKSIFSKVIVFYTCLGSQLDDHTVNIKRYCASLLKVYVLDCVFTLALF